MERADRPCIAGREFYIPHKPVVRAAAESTKLRVVYDASARAFDGAPSLNDCLHCLQNKLWSVLVRRRFNPVAITGDLQKAFLSVRSKRKPLRRNAFPLPWLNRESQKVIFHLSECICKRMTLLQQHPGIANIATKSFSG